MILQTIEKRQLTAEILTKCQTILYSLENFPQIQLGISQNLKNPFFRALVKEVVFHFFSLPVYNVQPLHWESLALHQSQNPCIHQTNFGLLVTMNWGHLTCRDSHHILDLRRNRPLIRKAIKHAMEKTQTHTHTHSPTHSRIPVF